MRRRTKIILALGATVLLALGWVVFKAEKEPEYQGKTLSEWLEEFRTGEWKKAEAAIRAIGTNAVPFLLDWIKPPETRDRTGSFGGDLLNTIRANWRMTYNILTELLDATHLHRRTPEDLKTRRQNVEVAFQILGPAAQSAIPTLSQFLYNVDEGDEFHARALAFILARLSPKECAPLCAALTNCNLAIRTAAAQAIAWSRNTNYAAAVPALVDCLHIPKCRVDAIRALGSLHSRPELSLPVLTCMLTNRDPFLRRITIEALGQFESGARPDLPVIIPLLLDPDQRVRESATNTVLKIDPNVLPK